MFGLSTTTPTLACFLPFSYAAPLVFFYDALSLWSLLVSAGGPGPVYSLYAFHLERSFGLPLSLELYLEVPTLGVARCIKPGLSLPRKKLTKAQ